MVSWLRAAAPPPDLRTDVPLLLGRQLFLKLLSFINQYTKLMLDILGNFYGVGLPLIVLNTPSFLSVRFYVLYSIKDAF